MDEFRLYNRALSAAEVAAIAGNVCYCYVDADGDGYGDASDPGVESQQAVCPMGTVDNNSDCDDTNPNINPEGTEVCDNIDNDCSGIADDDDDLDGDGYSIAQGDCDDCNSALNPGQTEICGNGIDDNCNGQIDEPVVLNLMDCGIFYGFSPFQDSVWTIDTTMNYAIVERRAPTLAGFTVTGINGAAKNPLTGQIYAIAKVSGVSGRVLCIFNPADATMTQLGNLGDNFSSITFSPSGQLFGVTGNGATVPETLYDIDPSNASKTLLTPLGNGADGEVICYNPDDNMIYHWSGNVTVVYEKILPVAPYTITDIPITGTTSGETFGAAYIGNNKFLISNISSSFNIITTNGTWGAAFGSLPDDLRGLPFASCDVTCYADADGDGYGDPNAPQVFQGTCSVGYVQNSQDCDDNDDSIYPCAQEICDGKDNDCDGLTDTNDPGFVDNTPPTVSCAGQVTLVFNGENSIQIDGVNSPVNLQIQANDNCGVQSITISPSTINANQVGQTVPVTITVTDFKGATATCNSSIVVSGLPEGWSAQPNGVGCSNGNSAQYNAGTGVWTATSTNCFYGPPYTSDATSFAQRTLCGDGSITAHVTSINGNGWAGVVMRESNAPGAKKAQLMTNLSQFHRREFRTTTNGAAQPQQIGSNNRHWLRIVRAGNQFTMYASANGISWFPVGAQNIAMSNCIQMGLVASNFTANSTVTATFSNVSFSGSNSGLGTGSIGQGAESIEPLQSFEVYPNPTGGELNVDLTQYIGRSVRMEVYSIEGKLLQFREIDEVQTAVEHLDLSQYAGGMYFIKVQSRELPAATKRVVMQRE